jgi:hypothetical protein
MAHIPQLRRILTRRARNLEQQVQFVEYLVHWSLTDKPHVLRHSHSRSRQPVLASAQRNPTPANAVPRTLHKQYPQPRRFTSLARFPYLLSGGLSTPPAGARRPSVGRSPSWTGQRARGAPESRPGRNPLRQQRGEAMPKSLRRHARAVQARFVAHRLEHAHQGLQRQGHTFGATGTQNQVGKSRSQPAMCTSTQSSNCPIIAQDVQSFPQSSPQVAYSTLGLESC